VIGDTRFSASEATRKIQQGGVRLAGEKLVDPRRRIEAAELPVVLQVGRRAVRLVDTDGSTSAT